MNKTKRYANIIFMIVLTTMLSVNFSTVKASSSPAPTAFTFWTATDGFEGSLWDRWSCWQTIISVDNFCSASSYARTGTKSGYIAVRSGWSDMRKWISVTPFMAGRRLYCNAQIYIFIRDVAIPDGLTAQLEVIDADTSQYISIQKINSTDQSSWQAITTPTWNPPHKNILVRLGGIGVGWARQTVELDDLSVQCMY